MNVTTDVVSGKRFEDLLGVDGVATGHQPTPLNRCRIFLSGRPGVGKSTLLNSNPNAVVIDLEDGGRTVDDPQALRFVPPQGSWTSKANAIENFVKKIIARKKAGHDDIQMVGIDTYDAHIELYSRDLMFRENLEDVGEYSGGHGKGYRVVRDRIFDQLDLLYANGIGWCVIAHTILKEVGGQSKYVMSCSASFMGMAFQKCEHMFFMEPATRLVQGSTVIMKDAKGKSHSMKGPTKTENSVVLRTHPGGGVTANDIKVRVPFPDEIQLPESDGWATLTKEYDKAVSKLIGETV